MLYKTIGAILHNWIIIFTGKTANSYGVCLVLSSTLLGKRILYNFTPSSHSHRIWSPFPCLVGRWWKCCWMVWRWKKKKKVCFLLVPSRNLPMGEAKGGTRLQAGKTIHSVEQSKLPELANQYRPHLLFTFQTHKFLYYSFGWQYLTWIHLVVTPDVNWCEAICSLYLNNLTGTFIDSTTEMSVCLTTSWCIKTHWRF